MLTASEIGEQLGLSTVTVRRLINKIDEHEVGIRISTIRGNQGGYKLVSSSFWSNAGISDMELEAFLNAEDFLAKSSGFTRLTEYSSGVNKLIQKKRVANIEDIKMPYTVVFKSHNKMDDREKEYVNKLYKCILDKTKVQIYYFSLNGNQTSNRILHPYKLYAYDGSNYVTGYCEKRNEIRDFKVSRIKKLDVIRENFKYDESFSFDEFIKDSFGIYKGKVFDVKLEIFPPHSQLVKESNYHTDQVIIENDDGSINFSAKLRGLEEIVTWIMSMGECVRVLEPIELKEKILKKYKKIFQSYKL